MAYLAQINNACAENQNFRKVLHTTGKSQLVAMRIPAGEDIGEETHAHVEQLFFFQSGKGRTILDGVESSVSAGDVLIVSPGTKHNIVNDGPDPLVIATIYVPPNHLDGTIHETKAEAIADRKDEAFGESIS